MPFFCGLGEDFVWYKYGTHSLPMLLFFSISLFFSFAATILFSFFILIDFIFIKLNKKLHCLFSIQYILSPLF